MAKVRCSCGRHYKVPDTHLGKPVKCAACGATFTAEAVAERTIGDEAVRRGYLTARALAGCKLYQDALKKSPRPDDRTLAMMLVQGGVLSKTAYNALLQAAAAPGKDAPAFKRDHPISQAKRDAIRQQAEAAAVHRERAAYDRQQLAAEAPEVTQLRLRVFVIPVVIVIAAIVAIAMWPAPKPTRVLEAYLRSADERNVAPDPELATRDLGIAVRRFGNLEVERSTRHEYAARIQNFVNSGQGTEWADMVAKGDLPEEDRQALRLVVPAIPGDIKPAHMATLQITVQPILCDLDFRRHGTGMYNRGRYRFHLVRAEGSKWSTDWKVAGYTLVGSR
jgi:hypothetical protein